MTGAPGGAAMWFAKLQRHPQIALGAILLLGWGLRLYRLDHLSLWADEGYSVALSSLAPPEMVQGTAAAQHPPLYYLLLSGWMRIAGRSEFAVRLSSAMVGWLTIPLLYRIGRRFGMGVGLAAAALLTASPAHIWYSQEARMYTLLVLLGTLSTWLAWQWWTQASARTWPRTLLYGFTTLAAMYTHNFAIFLIATHNLAGLLLAWLPRLRSGLETRSYTIRWLAGQATWVVGFSLWLPILAYQTTHHTMTWIPPVTWPAIRNSWLYLLYGTGWQGRWSDWVGAILGLGLAGLALWPAGRQSQANGRVTDRGWIGLWFWALALTIVVAARRLLIYQDKQLLILLPPLLLLLAMGLDRLRFFSTGLYRTIGAQSGADTVPGPEATLQGVWVRALPAAGLMAILALLAGPLRWQYTDAEKQEWRALAAHVDAQARPGDLVYFNAHAGKLTFNYYARSGLPQAGYPPGYTLVQGGWVGVPATSAVVAGQIDAIAARYSRVWLVDFAPGFWDPEGLIVTRLQEHYQEIQATDFEGVGLRLFVRRSGS